MSPPPPSERLDVESDESREARLGNLFSSLTNPASSAPAPPPGFSMPPSRPGPMPESDVLARARAFLPLMAASNASLLQRAAADPASVSVETPGGGAHVAMDVGLGVFDVQGDAGAAGEAVGPTVEREAALWEAAAAAVGDEEDDDEEDEVGEGHGGVLVREEPEDEEMSSGVDTSDSDSSSDGDSSADEE